jgi:hypothetical protein
MIFERKRSWPIEIITRKSPVGPEKNNGRDTYVRIADVPYEI